MKVLEYLYLWSFLFSGIVAGRSESWPCFRGPGHQGISQETGLPLHWNATSNILWKTEIPGESWSSPIVWGDRVFLTTATDGGVSCRILCLEANSGKVIWNKELLQQKLGHKQGRNTYATPTPCTDGQRVYAVFGDGSFVAVDFQGATTWVNRNLPFYGEHGLATSPILWGDQLIMARDGSNESDPKSLGWQQPWDKSFVVALDTKMGIVRWKTGRGQSRIGHVSPNIFTNAAGEAEIISGAGDVVQGFAAKTGKLLWSSKNTGEGVVPSVVLSADLAFVASGWGGRESIKAFKLDGQGDLSESNLAWEQKKGMPKVPSYLFVKSLLFVIGDNGVAVCLRAETGEIIWQERMKGSFSASPVAAEGRIYLTADSGDTTVIEAGPEFRVIASNPISERVQASLALSGGRLYLRSAQNLYCIGNK